MNLYFLCFNCIWITIFSYFLYFMILTWFFKNILSLGLKCLNFLLIDCNVFFLWSDFWFWKLFQIAVLFSKFFWFLLMSLLILIFLLYLLKIWLFKLIDYLQSLFMWFIYKNKNCLFPIYLGEFHLTLFELILILSISNTLLGYLQKQLL